MSEKNITIVSPANGTAVTLEQVPDAVFADKILGDGMAVIPSDGKFVSPIDGEVASVADSLHAIGFQTEDGLDVLIHIGLDTVKLNGEGFQVFVNVGDKVKKGDLVAEVDLEVLANNGLNPITPVIVCDGLDDRELLYTEGKTEAGKTIICETKTEEDVVEEIVEVEKVEKTPKKKFKINFDLLQKLGKVLMAVIAVMPAAGLMISLGKIVQMAGVDINLVFMVGSTMENIGWAIINNLHILFAVAIGGSWAKERAGGAFAAVIAFVLINCITGAIFGVTSGMLNDPTAVTHTLFGQEILVNGYFTSILGAPALNMGVFVGIISGFVGATAYNKYYNFRKLPDANSFTEILSSFSISNLDR